MSENLTAYQAKYFAHELRRSYANDHVGKLAGLLFDAQVEPKPHQIDAALFALQSPFLKGVILADEVGLGKTIEAGLVVTEYWAERKRRILVVVPSSLKQQWQQELAEKFNLHSELLDSRNYTGMLSADLASGRSPILICSYEFAQYHESALLRAWDLVVCDEAHRLRSFYRGAKIATAVSHVLSGSKKSLMLTATPLQNGLDELYGLVSTFDPEYFHSLQAFRERYVKGREFGDDSDLKDRVALIAKRTLRRDAQKYIHFTERLPLTVQFEPSKDEQGLYDLVNSYLLRDDLFAFTASQRHLSDLIIRKRLGSSTYAVASTLEHIADRLEGEINEGYRRDGSPMFSDDQDLTSDEAEEIVDAESQSPSTNVSTTDQLAEARAEVTELRGYATLARSITVNQKAVALERALDQGFAKLAELGAPRKTIIFTDSTKTQEYIAKSLTDAGWGGDGLVLFNGQNMSPQATAIYRQWLTDNEGSDLVTGNQTADRRKALVDYFRDHGQIMIATEAAAEGLNLQFCSMIVNYDLPWNPQRVEQRIGRCHRFGQKYNVVVVNFFNKGNIAEQRILELLTDKFHLFQGVFGASDEVLGTIEDGLDFETQISDILSRCHTAEDIQFEFDALDRKYAHDISKEMATTRDKVFNNLDPHVQDRLKTYDRDSGVVLNQFERLLLAVTGYSLRGLAEFSDDGRRFKLSQAPTPDTPTGTYFFKSKPIPNARQYRYDSPLATWVLDHAYQAYTPLSKVVFSIGATYRPTAQARALTGKSGVLTVEELTFRMKAGDDNITESYLIAAALTDGGQHLDDESVGEILNLASVKQEPITIPFETHQLVGDLDEQQQVLDTEVKGRNTRYYDQQEEIYYSNIEDRRAESDAIIRDYEKKAHEARKNSRQAEDPVKQLQLKREARTWQHKADEEAERARRERRELQDKQDEYIDLIGQALKGTHERTPLFSIRWEVTA